LNVDNSRLHESFIYPFATASYGCYTIKIVYFTAEVFTGSVTSSIFWMSSNASECALTH